MVFLDTGQLQWERGRKSGLLKVRGNKHDSWSHLPHNSQFTIMQKQYKLNNNRCSKIRTLLVFRVIQQNLNHFLNCNAGLSNFKNELVCCLVFSKNTIGLPPPNKSPYPGYNTSYYKQSFSVCQINLEKSVLFPCSNLSQYVVILQNILLLF